MPRFPNSLNDTEGLQKLTSYITVSGGVVTGTAGPGAAAVIVAFIGRAFLHHQTYILSIPVQSPFHVFLIIYIILIGKSSND